MTFTRTVSGRSNLPAFLGVSMVVYTEGGEFNKEKKQSDCSIDAVFWKGFFSRFLPGLSYEIRPLGSKDNLLPYAQDVAASKISNTIVAMDRDHDHHRHCLIDHPFVLYTYGYSWENDAWQAEAIISKETLNNLPLQSAFHFPTDFFNLTVLFCVYGPISGPVLLISG